MAESTTSTNSLSTKKVVIDTGALIKGVQLINVEADFYSIQEVLNEVKDPNSRRSLELIPVNLKIKEPDDDSLKKVTEFSRKTGDFVSLSRVDLKVLALTYMLEKEANGVEHLRTEPKRLQVIQNKDNPFFPVTPKLIESLSPQPEKSTTPKEQTPTLKSEETITLNPPEPSKTDITHKLQETTKKEDPKQTVSEQKPEPGKEEVKKLEVEQKTINAEGTGAKQDKNEENEEEEGEEEEEESEEGDQIIDPFKGGINDEDGWITPDNIKKIKTPYSGAVAIGESTIKVGCMTADFSIQNVLLQMGLHLLSIDGMVIKATKQWVLKCHACSKIHKEMDRLFCSQCGNNTLIKVAITIDENGIAHIQQPKRGPVLRGTIYSLPAPKGGRKQAVILCEDQIKKRKKKNKPFDYFDADHEIQLGKTQRLGYAKREVVVGLGKRNPNEVKKRTGNKKKNKE